MRAGPPGRQRLHDTVRIRAVARRANEGRPAETQSDRSAALRRRTAGRSRPTRRPPLPVPNSSGPERRTRSATPILHNSIQERLQSVHTDPGQNPIPSPGPLHASDPNPDLDCARSSTLETPQLCVATLRYHTSELLVTALSGTVTRSRLGPPTVLGAVAVAAAAPGARQRRLVQTNRRADIKVAAVPSRGGRRAGRPVSCRPP